MAGGPGQRGAEDDSQGAALSDCGMELNEEQEWGEGWW